MQILVLGPFLPDQNYGDSTKEEIAALLNTSKDKITLQYMSVKHQYGGSDCGLFALAFATALCVGLDPTACKFKQELMREHFSSCEHTADNVWNSRLKWYCKNCTK